MFLGLPILVFLLQIVAIQSPWFRIEEYQADFGYLGIFQGSLTALVLGLSGLNSLDKKNGT
jgi:hypothetical protein